MHVFVTIKLVDWEEEFGGELPSDRVIFWASCSQYKDCADRPFLELSTLCLTVPYNALLPLLNGFFQMLCSQITNCETT